MRRIIESIERGPLEQYIAAYRLTGTTSNGLAGAFSNDTLTWPDSTTTGYTNAPGYTSLSAGPGTLSSGTTYSFKSWTGATFPSLSGVNNVTFIGCLIEGHVPDFALAGTSGGSSDGIAFYWCTFRPDNSAASYRTYASGNLYQYAYIMDGSTAHSLTVMYCEFWGFGNAFQVNGSSQAKPHIFRHNYFHHAGDNNGSFSGDTGTYHHDGILNTVGGANYAYAVIDHNYFASYGNTNAIALQLDGGSGYGHITACRNKITGWGYGTSMGNSSAGNNNNVFVDNWWSTLLQPLFGPIYDWTGTNRTWRRNRWSVPSGADYGSAADDGKYMTSGGSPSATDSSAEGTTYPYYCTAIRATPGSSQASVEFTAPTDTGGASITGYRVSAWTPPYYPDYSTVVTTQTGASSPITVSGLTPGTAYVFTVAATNSVGYGYESAPCGAVTIL